MLAALRCVRRSACWRRTAMNPRFSPRTGVCHAVGGLSASGACGHPTDHAR
jgi:hypothetical protein